MNIFPNNRLQIAINLTFIAWVISKLICFKLWTANRLFPLVPVNGYLNGLPDFLHILLLVISLAGMILYLVFPKKKLVILVLITEILSCCLDQNRWQPWEYMFLFMASAYIFCREEKFTLLSWQLIIGGLYFFGGIGKMNSGFIHDTWNYLMLHRWLGIEHASLSITRSGYLLPLIEMCAGAGLLFRLTRKPSVWVLVAMHIVILLMLGPSGLNINHVVWPWNLLMISLLLLLFNNKESFSSPAILFSKPFTWIIIACWWILPWFQLAGYWDKYLSSVLYSGGLEQLFICTNNTAAKNDLHDYFDNGFKVIPCTNVLSVYNWGIKEMRTAPYPEPRVFREIIRQWKLKYPGKDERFFLYKPGFAYTVKEIVIP